MSRPFQKGDRVVVMAEAWPAGEKLFSGKRGTVHHVHIYSDGPRVEIELDDPGPVWGRPRYYPRELMLEAEHDLIKNTRSI